jgi:hypothetical protein
VNSRNNKIPVWVRLWSGLGGDGGARASLRPTPLAQTERLCSGTLHSQAMYAQHLERCLVLKMMERCLVL